MRFWSFLWICSEPFRAVFCSLILFFRRCCCRDRHFRGRSCDRHCFSLSPAGSPLRWERSLDRCLGLLIFLLAQAGMLSARLSIFIMAYWEYEAGWTARDMLDRLSAICGNKRKQENENKQRRRRRRQRRQRQWQNEDDSKNVPQTKTIARKWSECVKNAVNPIRKWLENIDSNCFRPPEFYFHFSSFFLATGGNLDRSQVFAGVF